MRNIDSLCPNLVVYVRLESGAA